MVESNLCNLNLFVGGSNEISVPDFKEPEPDSQRTEQKKPRKKSPSNKVKERHEKEKMQRPKQVEEMELRAQQRA